MQSFRELHVWRKGHELTLMLYRLTARFPREELFGLTRQIRRAASSIPANIAEGCGRGSDADFGRFLQMAMGSASELEYHLILAHELGYLEITGYETCTDETIQIKRMLTALLTRL